MAGPAGNSLACSYDYSGVECAKAREAISALLDGESAGIERALLGEHLAGCAACRGWQEDAHELTRRTRLAPADEPPVPSRQLLAAAAEACDGRRRWRSLPGTRAGLAGVAAAQAMFAVPDLVLGHDRGAPVHVAHETGSFEMALALGFLVAAWRPARAQGMRALVGWVALLLVGTAVLDLLGGRTSGADEAPHLLAVAGWLLVRRLAALVPSDGDDHAAGVLHRARARTGIGRRADAGSRAQRGETLVDPGGVGASESPARLHDEPGEAAQTMAGEGSR